MVRGRPSGLQLIEVVIAGFVFFLVSLFVLNLLPTSLWAVSKAETRMTAEAHAFSTLEQLRGQAFASHEIGDFSAPPRTVDGIELLTTYTVSEVEDSDPQLIKDIEVTVAWRVREQTHQVKAHTYVSRLRN